MNYVEVALKKSSTGQEATDKNGLHHNFRRGLCNEKLEGMRTEQAIAQGCILLKS